MRNDALSDAADVFELRDEIVGDLTEIVHET